MIRLAGETDRPWLVAMGLRFVQSTSYAALMPITPAAVHILIDNLLEQGVIFVAVLEDRPIGMLAGRLMPSGPEMPLSVAEEVAWWVEPEHRDGRAGYQLLCHFEGWAVQSGADVCKMVAPAGTTVGGFYERRGYRAVETVFAKVLHGNVRSPRSPRQE